MGEEKPAKVRPVRDNSDVPFDRHMKSPKAFGKRRKVYREGGSVTIP
jgi:hypothetical protein